MKYYLSSYKIGNEIEKLKDLIPSNKRTAYISNALDFSTICSFEKFLAIILCNFFLDSKYSSINISINLSMSKPSLSSTFL